MCVDEKMPDGKSELAELIPNGSQVPVTNENRMLYIMKYSNYMLNVRTQKQISAFVKGLRVVIPLEYTSYFFPDEIQLLISGGTNDINFHDLQDHT